MAAWENTLLIAIDEEVEMLDGKRDVLHRGDPLYPEALLKLADPPQELFVCGDPLALGDDLILVTGSRRATPYGISCAALIGRIASERGITVVSGGAMGCEASALRAAMQAGGRIVVWAGSGPDVMYPHSSRDIFEAASTGAGCVVSEQPWGTGPLRSSFVHRRLLMVAVSDSIVVAEAGMRSGTTSIANAAVELGKKVYAFPGSIFSPESRGSNALISDGAVPIIDAEDFRLSLMIDYPARMPSRQLIHLSQTAPQDTLTRYLIASPMTLEQLVSALEIEPVEVLRELHDREVQGLVVRLPDGRWSRTAKELDSCTVHHPGSPEYSAFER